MSLGNDLLIPLAEIVFLGDIDTNESCALDLPWCEYSISIVLLTQVSNLLFLLLGLLRSGLGSAILLALLGLRDFQVLHLAVGGCGFGHCRGIRSGVGEESLRREKCQRKEEDKRQVL